MAPAAQSQLNSADKGGRILAERGNEDDRASKWNLQVS